MIRRLLVLSVTLALALPTSAEVRLGRDAKGEPTLEVRPTPAGIWAPRALPNPAVVNPTGDQWGDGYPASASRDGRLLGAWVRGASGEVVLLRAQGQQRSALTTVAAPDAVGTPTVTPVGDHWVVAWTTLGMEPSVSLTVATVDHDGDPEVVLPGQLVAVVPIGHAVHVLSYLASTGELQVATIVALHWPEPFPISTSRTIVDLRLTMHLPEPFPVPIHNRGLGMHLPQPIPIPIPTTAAWSPCIEVRADDALVAWVARDHQVGSIVLDDLGVVDAARFVRGPSGSCTAVLNAASRGE